LSEIRFLTSSDEHLADLSPGFRKDDYRSAILDKLAWQADMARRFQANAVLRGGDLFHVKEANKTTMATLGHVAKIHAGGSCPTFAVAGNHDMSRNDPDSLPRQPLGVLFRSRAVSQLRDETFESGTLRVRVVGVEYTVGMEEAHLHDSVRKKDGSDYTIAFVHALAAYAPEERIQSFFHEHIFDYRDLVFDGCPDVYIFGHYHKDQGVQEHLGIKFVNLGAVSRGALTFENMERKPKVSLIKCDSRGVHVEEHIIPHADALNVFDLEKKKQLDAERRSLNDFLVQLRAGASAPEDGGIRNRLEDLKNSNMADDVKVRIEEILEAAEAGTLDE